MWHVGARPKMARLGVATKPSTALCCVSSNRAIMAVMADVVRRRGYCLVGAVTVIAVLALLLGPNPVGSCHGFNAETTSAAPGAALVSELLPGFDLHVAVFPLDTCIDPSFAWDRADPELNSAQTDTPGGRLRLTPGSVLSGRSVLSGLRRNVCRMANIPPPREPRCERMELVAQRQTG
jgi:hypothetical protein